MSPTAFRTASTAFFGSRFKEYIPLSFIHAAKSDGFADVVASSARIMAAMFPLVLDSTTLGLPESGSGAETFPSAIMGTTTQMVVKRNDAREGERSFIGVIGGFLPVFLKRDEIAGKGM